MNEKAIKLAYLAGTLDGDGSFSLIKGTSHSSKSPLYYPMIQLANAYEVIIDIIFNELGGHRGIRKSYTGKDGITRLPSYHWKLEKSAKCLPVLEDIIPYLVIKQERAQFLRDYILNNPFKRGSNRISDHLNSQREKAYLKMRSFNDNPSINGKLFSIAKRIDSIDPVFWSYVAGIMDTDGSFSLKKENKKQNCKHASYIPMILLTMTDCRAIYYIMNNFIGGNTCIVKAKTTNNGFCYRFNISGRLHVIKFLRQCIPFLHAKQKVAQELLNFCEKMIPMGGPKGVSKEQLLFREQYYDLILSLNNGVYKSPLIVLKTQTDNAVGNKEQAGDEPCSLNAVSEENFVENEVCGTLNSDRKTER